jgi:hypothetical protein
MRVSLSWGDAGRWTAQSLKLSVLKYNFAQFTRQRIDNAPFDMPWPVSQNRRNPVAAFVEVRLPFMSL